MDQRDTSEIPVEMAPHGRRAVQGRWKEGRDCPSRRRVKIMSEVVSPAQEEEER